MSGKPNWLPDSLDYTTYNGAWAVFLADVYAIFERDFKSNRPTFRGLPVVFDARLMDGMEEGFWHVTSGTDRDSGARIYDFRRCERIAWMRAIIDNSHDAAVSVWSNLRGGQRRWLLWLEDMDYILVLAERNRVMALVTAYCADREHTRRKLRQERDRS